MHVMIDTSLRGDSDFNPDWFVLIFKMTGSSFPLQQFTLYPNSSWTIFRPQISRYISIAFRWRRNTGRSGDGAEGGREKCSKWIWMLDSPCLFLCSKHSIRCQSCFTGLNYWLHEGKKKDGVFSSFEYSSFCLPLTLLVTTDWVGRLKGAWNNSAWGQLPSSGLSFGMPHYWDLQHGSKNSLKTLKPQGLSGWQQIGKLVLKIHFIDYAIAVVPIFLLCPPPLSIPIPSSNTPT